jgi:hypothetical protein
MKKQFLLIPFVLSASLFLPYQNATAQRLVNRFQGTVPGVTSNCLNYMIMETGNFACLSYSQSAETTPTETPPTNGATEGVMPSDQPVNQEILTPTEGVTPPDSTQTNEIQQQPTTTQPMRENLLR